MKRVKSIILVLAMTLSFTIAFAATHGGAEAYAASATPISTAEDLLLIEQNPGGSYYLTKDIVVPANTTMFEWPAKFTGVLDGKGHKLKSYKYTGTEYCEAAIFAKANGATFKNLLVTGVDINITSAKGAKAAGLVGTANNCKFTNVKATGKINVKGTIDSGEFRVGGIAAEMFSCKTTNCTNSVSIIVSGKSVDFGQGALAGGLAGDGAGTTFKNCKNTGAISVSGYTPYYSLQAGGIVGRMGKNFYSCKNSGKITVQALSGESTKLATAAGICGQAEYLTGCGNTGNIKATSANAGSRDVRACGLAAEASRDSEKNAVTKCYNKGRITLSGKMVNVDEYADGGGYAAGLCGSSTKTTQCYNKGKVQATVTKGNARVGGLVAFTGTMNNCYNVGKVSLTGKGNVGGVAGYAYVVGTTITKCYNAATITGKKKANKGSVIGSYTGADVVAKRNIYNNYYKKNTGSPYGRSSITWGAWKAKAIKVSSITKKNCPKLSSKYWTYSSKYKRLILKNNKETK